MREMPAIVQDRLIFDLQPPSQSLRTESDKAVQAMREQVILAARRTQSETLVRERESVFLPGAEKERYRTMVKQIEKILERSITSDV